MHPRSSPAPGRPPTAPAPQNTVRVLLVSASMGAGHDTVAAELARRIRARGGDALTVDVLALLPYGLGRALRLFYRGSVRHVPWAYAALYRFFLRPGTGRRPSGTPLARLAGDRLRGLADHMGADVVVPVFHLGAQLTGHLRARGLLRVPSAVLVIDFAVHRQWLHPGNDLCLCLTRDVAREVRERTGASAAVCGPVVAPEFFTEDGEETGGPHGVAGGRGARTADETGADGATGAAGGASGVSGGSVAVFGASGVGAAGWRVLFGRYGPGRAPVVLSAGAWGVGSRLEETIRLLADHGFLPVVLCGNNERLRRELSGVPGAVALGWVEDMPGLLHAARALVDNAAGQTAVQALAAGLPVVGYRPIPGHGADGVRRMAALGVSEVAEDDASLIASLRRLTAPGPARGERVAAGRALFESADAVALVAALADAARVRR